jgi:hypothetical protein
VPKQQQSSFFPQSWNKEKIVLEIKGAYANSMSDSTGKWSEESSSGIKIEGGRDKDGGIATAFPKYE